MKSLRYYPYTLELRNPFALASGTRTSTPALMVEIERNGIIGFGEAAMPPYLGETQNTACAFLSNIDLNRYPDLGLFEDILSDVDRIAPGNNAAKAAVDIALHDWIGKAIGQPWHRIWGLDPEKTPFTSFTFGIDQPEVLRRNIEGAPEFKIYKLKLGRDNDKEIIDSARTVTQKPLRVDVNQGWTDRENALAMCEWLASRGVEFVEQPMPKERIDDIAWLRSRSPIPIIADESVARREDIVKTLGAFDGINVKLMKCGGMHEAYKMIVLAKSLGLKVMIGCMTETSCAISAATQLSPLADWADLDGALLIRNDLFNGATISGGKVTMPKGNGIGVTKKVNGQ